MVTIPTIRSFLEFGLKRGKAMKRFLFNFNIAYLYAFIAGILVSLAINLFTSALLTTSLPMSIHRVYGIALSLFISSIGAFGVSALLENARGEWESAGSPYKLKRDFIERRKYIVWMYFSLAIFLSGVICSVLLYIWRK
ncbi:membrane protein [Candidatus Desulfofervidus auxilii]|uniref:Membrane protein n=1 Tax=Desulfofervidus auxilii TaxID=1621989 RepID=A0A7U4QJE4_DESA2|nr:hypothetical protein [Candidatus Desulfofervidus auxilii]AMM40468.1 membrane protein [Candidatus Desulfofervidus auxilii]CAD7772431.1 hypothetical protein BLFGPEAP_00769 [Candidatus Methanoperedenaceae archaeon GB50]CAD7773893.1 hypothetical protein DMNBHIDG_00830 [Candidatus Methanoperedenaceae archaeon GB37]